MNEFYKTLTNPKGKYGVWGIMLVVVFGAALMIVPGWFLGKSQPLPEASRLVSEKSTPKEATNSLGGLETTLAQEVSKILAQVEGAGKVAVSVSLASGLEQNFAKNITENKSTIEEKDTSGGTRVTTELNQKAEVVFAQGRGEPLVIKEVAPEIKGVLVVAEGASDVEIRNKLSRAVQAMLNLPAHRVMVLPKEGR